MIRPNNPGPISFPGLFRRHWPSMALGGSLALLAALGAIGLLSLSGWFIAAAAYAGMNTATAKAFNFFIPSIGVRLFAMMRTGARYGERVISHDATFRILETLRTRCYERLEPLSPAGLSRHHTADLLTRIITDIDTLDNLYLRVTSPTVVAGVTVTLLVGFISFFCPSMALYCGVLFVAAGIAVPLVAGMTGRRAARDLNEQTARLRTAIVDGIQGLAALLACGAQQRHLERIHNHHRTLIRDQEKMSQLTAFFTALQGLLCGLAVIGALYIGADAVMYGDLSGPYLVLLTLAVMAGFEVVAPLPSAYTYLGQTRIAAVRLHEIMDDQPAVTFPEDSMEIPEKGSIEFETVSFQYARTTQPVLRNISFTIDSGQNTAIMGATGSGKSTLLYLLSRFEDPSTGMVRLGQQSLPSWSESALRQHICIVDQKAHIFSGTLRDNLKLADPKAETKAMEQALSTVELMDFVRRLPDGLNTWVGEAGRLLSGGQARRLAIARAVLSKARVLAFDEPTEGLDTKTATCMMNNLIEHAQDRTLIMITHRTEAIEHMDQVILLDAGRIAAVASPSELKRKNSLYRCLLSETQ